VKINPISLCYLLSTIHYLLLNTPPDKNKINNLVKFSHRAMNANFEILIQHDDKTYAGQVARNAFNQVDRLESLLSRFIENSDVARINLLAPGDFAVVDPDTINTIRIAQKAWRLTGGAFDITIGTIIEAWKNNDASTAQKLLAEHTGMKQLELDDAFAVKVLGGNVSIDLGGIGKGYAVDVIANMLREWDIKKAFIHGGASSVCALDGPDERKGWPITLSSPIDNSVIMRLEMKKEVLSCSGLQQGRHIINPFTGQPVTDRRACWVKKKKNAALADALTTAGMIMPIEKIRKLQTKSAGLSVMVLMTQEKKQPHLIKMGLWT